jgi:hypothetical protein
VAENGHEGRRIEMSGVLSIEKTDREVGLDSYFNKTNAARALCAYSDMLAGRNSAEHDLIELNDEEDMA